MSFLQHAPLRTRAHRNQTTPRGSDGACTGRARTFFATVSRDIRSTRPSEATEAAAGWLNVVYYIHSRTCVRLCAAECTYVHIRIRYKLYVRDVVGTQPSCVSLSWRDTKNSSWIILHTKCLNPKATACAAAAAAARLDPRLHVYFNTVPHTYMYIYIYISRVVQLKMSKKFKKTSRLTLAYARFVCWIFDLISNFIY